MRCLRPLFLSHLALSYFLGYLIPLVDAGILLLAFIALLLLAAAKNDRALIAFSFLFFVAGSIRGVSLGMPYPEGDPTTGRETVRFLGIVAEVKQSGPLVGFVVKEGCVEKVYGGNEVRCIPKFVVYTFGDSDRYEGREGNRILGLGRIQQYSLAGERPMYAAGALLRGFAYKIDADREKIIFFGKRRDKGVRKKFADNIIGALQGDRKYEMGRDFIVTILTGRRSYHSEYREVLIDSGLAHLLAISGLHVGVAFLFFGLVSRLFFLIFNRLGFVFDINTLSMALGAGAAMAYAFLAGMPVTVSRAFSMMIFSALAVRKCDDGSVFTPLAFAFFVIILQEPADAFTVSFVFSFAITFYLLLILGGFPPGKKYKVKIGLSISLTAYCASIPLSAYFFHKVALFGFVYNFFFVPLFIPLIGVALVWAFLCVIHAPMVKLAGGGVVMLSDTLIRSVRWLTGYTGDASKVIMPDMISVLSYFLAFTFIFLLSKKKDKNADTVM